MSTSAQLKEATSGDTASSVRRWAERAVMLGAVAALLAAPFYVGSDYALRVATLICMFGTMALGWNLIGGYANQVSLGHGAFFGFGAYTAAILQLNYGISPWIGILVGAVISALVAVVVGTPTFLLSGHYFALATLALLQVANILFRYFSDVTGGPGGLSLPLLGNAPAMFQFGQPIWYFYAGAAMLLVTLWISRMVLYSKLGYRLRAVKENPEAAQLAGVNLFRSKLIALIISAVIVSTAGVFYLQFLQFINPDSTFSFDVSINMALFAIIGGVTTWWGPAVGALILVPLGEYTSLKLTGQLAPLGQFIYGLLLIAVILVRPRGLGEGITRVWDRLMRRVS